MYYLFNITYIVCFNLHSLSVISFSVMSTLNDVSGMFISVRTYNELVHVQTKVNYFLLCVCICKPL